MLSSFGNAAIQCERESEDKVHANDKVGMKTRNNFKTLAASIFESKALVKEVNMRQTMN